MVATGNKPVRIADLSDCCSNVVVPLAGDSFPFWLPLLDLPAWEAPAQSLPHQVLPDGFVRGPLAHLAVAPRTETAAPEYSIVTIIDCHKTRKFCNLPAFVERPQALHAHSNFDVVDFAAISLREQVQLVQETDALVSHHDAGTTHVLFLPPEAAAIEIFPAFLPLARLSPRPARGLAHFVGH